MIEEGGCMDSRGGGAHSYKYVVLSLNRILLLHSLITVNEALNYTAGCKYSHATSLSFRLCTGIRDSQFSRPVLPWSALDE